MKWAKDAGKDGAMGSLILLAVALAATSQPFAAAGLGLMALAVYIGRDI